MKTHVQVRKPASGLYRLHLAAGSSKGQLTTSARVRQIVAGQSPQHIELADRAPLSTTAPVVASRPQDSCEKEADFMAATIHRNSPPNALLMREPAEPRGDSDDEKTLKDGVSNLVQSRFGGDYKKAFSRYAGPDGSIEESELITLLKDADVGNRITRSTWAEKIIEKLDANKNGKIEWSEFSAKLK